MKIYEHPTHISKVNMPKLFFLLYCHFCLMLVHFHPFFFYDLGKFLFLTLTPDCLETSLHIYHHWLILGPFHLLIWPVLPKYTEELSRGTFNYADSWVCSPNLKTVYWGWAAYQGLSWASERAELPGRWLRQGKMKVTVKPRIVHWVV